MSVLLNFNGGKDFVVLFLPAMFIEIAVYGSFILYEVEKKQKIKIKVLLPTKSRLITNKR